MGFLIFDDDSGKPKKLELVKKETLIGRSRKACIQLKEDPRVSGVHCKIIRDSRGVLIRDNNSRNGTFVNGQWLEGKPVKLEDGDNIRLGITRFTYEKKKDEETASVASKLRELLRTRRSQQR